jgi:hypothetical protein
MDDATHGDRLGDQASVTRLAAERYAQRGWSVIPVPHRSKNPGFIDWQQLRLTADSIGEHFNGQPQKTIRPAAARELRLRWLACRTRPVEGRR